MIYLAQPYTHPNPEIKQWRYEAALRITADYTKLDFLIYSPIVHYHNVALQYKLPGDFLFWRELNFRALERCSEIWILTIPGWEDSLGLRAEIREAVRLNIPATYLNEDARRVGRKA